MATGGGSHSQLGRGDCDDGEIIRCETLCPPLPRSTLRADKTGERTVVDHQRYIGTVDGEKLVTQPAVHSMSDGVHSTRSNVVSQASQPSPSDDFQRDLSEGRQGQDVVMTRERLSSQQTWWAGDAVKCVYVPGDSES